MSAKQYEGKCALKRQDAKLQVMIVDLLLHEDKILDNMKRILADMSWEALGSFRNKAVLFDKFSELYDKIHGKKGETTQGTFNVIIEAPENLKEVLAKRSKGSEEKKPDAESQS